MNDRRGTKKGGRGGRGGKGGKGKGGGGFFGKNAKVNRHIFKIRTDADVAADNAVIAEDEDEGGDQIFNDDRFDDGGRCLEDSGGHEESTNLDKWHEFEEKNTRFFAGMYQFWCHKVE